MLILIDNGHGLDTPGKSSPDDKFPEATYAREIARRVVADLIDRDYNAQLLVPEPEDVPRTIQNPGMRVAFLRSAS